MKALILSAGLGTRLRPLTEYVPKTMVEIAGRPLLWYHINHLKKHGIHNIWINLHWYPNVIKNYFKGGSEYGVKIKYSFEKELLGTSGALRNPDSKIEKEFRKGIFLVVYGDNLTNFDYSTLIHFHSTKNSVMTIGLFEFSEPWTAGAVQTREDGKIEKFIEKPPKEEVKTNTVFAGVVVCEPEILGYIPEGFSDFGFDVIPKLLALGKPLYAFNPHSYVQDCGTHERLTKAKSDLEKKIVEFDFK